jgi:hypothetical protein
MMEPKAVEKTNASTGPEKLKSQIFLVKILPTFRNPIKIKRKKRASICGYGKEGLVSY